MAALSDSVLTVYSISTTIFESLSMPNGYSIVPAIAPTDLLVTLQPMPNITIEQQQGQESTRQSWS